MQVIGYSADDRSQIVKLDDGEYWALAHLAMELDPLREPGREIDFTNAFVLIQRIARVIRDQVGTYPASETLPGVRLVVGRTVTIENA